MMAMEVWTPKSTGETRDYVRVTMNEKVTLYISKHGDRKGVLFTDVRFFGSHHAKRAEAYRAMAADRCLDYWGDETSSTVRVTRN